jgi:hypothetical protein
MAGRQTTAMIFILITVFTILICEIKKHIRNRKNIKSLKENELEDNFDEFTDQFII